MNLGSLGTAFGKAKNLAGEGFSAIHAVTTNQPYPARTLLITLFLTVAAVVAAIWVASKIVSSK